MPTSSPSANKILVDLAIARESARVAAQSDLNRKSAHRRLIVWVYSVLAEELPELDNAKLSETTDKIVAAVERAGSASPER
jgi:hypothetical protein